MGLRIGQMGESDPNWLMSGKSQDASYQERQHAASANRPNGNLWERRMRPYFMELPGGQNSAWGKPQALEASASSYL